jgi:O-antigen biosynthesis protein WbqV
MPYIRWYALLTRARRFMADILLCCMGFSAVIILPILQTAGMKPFYQVQGPLLHLVLFAISATFSLAVTRTYRMIWRYVSFQDLLTLIKATTLALVCFALAEYLFVPKVQAAPLALLAWTFALIWLADVGFLSTPRLIARVLSETHFLGFNASAQKARNSASIILTGDASRIDSFIRECDRDPASGYRIAGVLTDDTRLHGSYLHGVKVLGSADHLPLILQRLNEQGIRPNTLVFADENVSRRDIARVLELTSDSNIKIGRLPPRGLFQGAPPVQPIELSDLLGRPEVTTDSQAVASLVGGKCVFITGAGGSIGSELSRQIAQMRPAKLVVVDASEFNLYSINEELKARFSDLEVHAALLNMRDGDLVSEQIRTIKPDIVFHAAALKHVPLLENHPIEAIRTNVFGTASVAEACLAHGVPTMVTISTDKAVNPTNVMGATKRLAEAYCQGLDQSGVVGNGAGRRTRFVTVRFGNVLGSAGSVVPLFERQIEQGGPVTVTHPEINRFFMTIPEAVSLVLQAGALGFGADEDRGSIYVLDMGQPVKIIDLARQMIRLSGQRPDVDIKIEIIGLRPGEKLYEEVMHCDEAMLPTQSKSVLKFATRLTDLRIIQQQIQELKVACAASDLPRALRLLKLSVPEFESAKVLTGAQN